MLAKMWKKVLLAICIIACLFNLVSKLVNRHSLETNLKSANDGNTVIDSLKTENETSDEEQIYFNNVYNEENNIEENVVIDEQEDNEDVSDEDINSDDENNETEENTSDTENENKTVYKASDFTIIF